MTIFSSTNLQKKLSPSYIILRVQKQKGANSVDLDEVAQFEPPHQNLRCLQIQLFSSLVLKELNRDWQENHIFFFSGCKTGFVPSKNNSNCHIVLS